MLFSNKCILGPPDATALVLAFATTESGAAAYASSTLRSGGGL